MFLFTAQYKKMDVRIRFIWLHWNVLSPSVGTVQLQLVTISWAQPLKGYVKLLEYLGTEQIIRYGLQPKHECMIWELMSNLSVKRQVKRSI
jgi:hypothetical protein